MLVKLSIQPKYLSELAYLKQELCEIKKGGGQKYDDTSWLGHCPRLYLKSFENTPISPNLLLFSMISLPTRKRLLAIENSTL